MPTAAYALSAAFLALWPGWAGESIGGVRASTPAGGCALDFFAALRRLASLGISPMEGSLPRLKLLVCERAVVGVLNALRLEGLRKAVVMSSALGEMADSAIGVTPAAIGVWPPSLDAKNLDLELWSPKDVMSLSADVFAMLR
jgi:hypothetical protein